MLVEEGVVFVSSFVALFLEVMSSALFLLIFVCYFGCAGSPAAASRASLCGRAPALGAVSVVVAHRLRCPTACGIFPHQGVNLCPLH